MKKTKPYYGWVICGCCMLAMFCNMGLVSNQSAIMLPYIIEENGFSNTQASLLPTIRCAVNFLSMLAADYWYRRAGLRLGLTLATASAALSMVLYALAHSLSAYYAAAALSGFGYGIGTMIPLTLLLNNWFPHKLGATLGLATVGSSIAGIAFPPILTLFVEQRGLAATYWMQAAVILVSAVLLWLLLRDTPQHKGVRLPGAAALEKQAALQKAKTNVDHAPRVGMSRRDQMLMLFVLALCGMIGVAGPMYWGVHLRLCAYTPMLIAAVFSLECITEGFGKVICGAAMDRFGAYRANYIFFFLLAGGNVLICLLSGSAFPLILSMAMTGLGMPVTMVGISLWAGDLVHRSELPRTVKHYQAACAAGGMIGSPLIGALADISGSYRLVYVLLALCCGLCLLLVQRAYRRYVKEKTTLGRGVIKSTAS